MKSVFKYLIVFIVFGCYSQAAFEVNFGTIQNTFGDEYDTYVQSENKATVHHQKIDHSNDFALVPEFEFTFQSAVLLNSTSYTLPYNSNFTQPSQRYILFCSLLI